MELFWAGVIVAILLCFSGIFAWRQIQTLRWLGRKDNVSPEDRLYFRRRSYRRLCGCLLTAVLAGLFVGLFAFGIMQELDRLVDAAQGAQAEGRSLSPDDEAFLAYGLRYVCAIGAVVMGLLAVAFVDLLATRKFGIRHRKRIQDDRRAMLQRQLPLLRQERNGTP